MSGPLNGLKINASITDEVLALREHQARTSDKRAAFDALLAFGEFSDVAGKNAQVCAAWIVELERRAHNAEAALVEYDRASVRRETEHAAALELARYQGIVAGGPPAAYLAMFEAAREYGHALPSIDALAKLIGLAPECVPELLHSLRGIYERLPKPPKNSGPKKPRPRPPPTRVPGPGRKRRG